MGWAPTVTAKPRMGWRASAALLRGSAGAEKAVRLEGCGLRLQGYGHLCLIFTFKSKFKLNSNQLICR